MFYIDISHSNQHRTYVLAQRGTGLLFVLHAGGSCYNAGIRQRCLPVGLQRA